MPADIEACVSSMEGRSGVDNAYALCNWMKSEGKGYFAKGSPSDEKAIKQAIAEFKTIRASMITEDQAFPFNAVLALQNGESATPTGDPLEYWKEIAHEGQFVKDTGNSHIEFAITPRMMDHWYQTFAEMVAEGMQVPVPVEHTRDPEKRRGTVVELARRKNKRGLDALYARIKFNDADSAKLAKSANVSVFVPKKVTSGISKKTYVMPLEHLALTDYPVLHDLEPFQAIALSMTSEGDLEVTIRELATQAGIDPAITDEQQLILALSQKLTQLQGAQQQRPPAPPGAAPPRPPMPPRPGFGASRGQSADQDGASAVPPLSGTLLKTVKDARMVILNGLSTGDRAVITPATRDALAKRFVTDEGLAFSHVDGFDDGFDDMIEALKKNPPIKQPSRTGAQAGVALSKDGDDPTAAQGDNGPLVRAMESRAKAAGSGRVGYI